MGKVVLAYSGGLDTTVAIKWIGEKYGLEVMALTVDVGAEKDFASIKERALKAGAIKSVVLDARERFVKYFVFPALKADAIYEGHYPLATALGRPLIAKLLVDTAHQEGASAVAHGCTGKGNDQVRFDVSVGALDPELKIIAPAREWGMTREQEIAYARRHALPIAVTSASPYSIDANLWGRSIECGVLEDPWIEPPEDIFGWTRSVDNAPDQPCYIEIGFDHGIPLSLNGEEMDGVSLINELNSLAGEHGVGRIDHVENRLVGIKSREIYEAPAATVLLKAHRALEDMTLSKDQLRFKERVVQEYADLIYNGLWYSALHQDLAAYVESTQRFVTGTVRLKLLKGNCTVVGRKSPKSLYRLSLATYDKGDIFDQSASPGFIHIWGLPIRTQAQIQGQPESVSGIIAPKEEQQEGLMRSFDEVWAFIKKLRGKTVYTLDMNWGNKIIDVTEGAVYRLSDHSRSGEVTSITRGPFEKIWNILAQNGKCVADKGVPNLVYAVLNELPEVGYTQYPLTLCLTKP